MDIVLRKRVGIKTLWPKETDFSKWLSQADGVILLAEELGLEVEDLRCETMATNYPCDVLGNLVGDADAAVVIENQYGKTNHDHLGKLLTYAASHRAMTAIWIAEQASEDHRAAVDWLNENTPPAVRFYLAELEAFVIGDSAAAPHLKVISQPNTTMKAKGPAGSPAEQWVLAYWSDISEAIVARNPPFALPKPTTWNWMSVAIGKAGFGLNTVLTPMKKSVRAEIYITTAWKEAAFACLEAQRDAIEAELGHPLTWMPLPGTKSARIALEHELDPKPEQNRRKVCEWFAQVMPTMYRVFKDRIAQLQPPA